MAVRRDGQMRSRWLFIALVTAAVLICTRLGLWQLGRHFARRSANGLAAVARAGEPRILPGVGYLAPDVPVVATGSFDHEHEFVLRGRAYDGAPGVEIATPFRMEGSDTALIVVRGFVPSNDAMSVDRTELREEGVRTIRGIAFPLPLDGIPLERNGDTTWSRIPGAWIEMPGHFPYPVYRYALWQEKESGMPGFPIRVGAPALTTGPHLSYAIQWFAFAVIFGVGGIAYIMKKGQGTEVVP
jgi:surfeit locus 1 family protein